jgi:uncharacterized protein (TIGR00251 family)
MLAVRREGDRISFVVRVTPRASANVVTGVREGALVVRVTAPPVEGKANAAVVALLSTVLGVPRGQVRVDRGPAARTKRVSVPRGAAAALEGLTK